MRELKIAVGNSRKTKTWVNRVITWEDLCGKLANTRQTTETIEEFLKMKKSDQDEIKDVGGYVMGHLKEGRRKTGHVLCRSCIALDMDFATPGIMSHVKETAPYMGCAYGTHKYTTEKPRLRILFPLLRDISEEEYPAVARI